MGYQKYIQPCYYYDPRHHGEGDCDNELKNINNIKIDVICPECCRPRSPKVCRNKLVNINRINIYVDGCKVHGDRW
ncbi:MAG: hypothetical protein QM451_02525 [Bacillota bacterium]|jgi:hypothetical protein|nr:hypothetical protein [Bacillota bacterium]HHT91150.1 hypothetical protein [Bacillota bacterium]